MTSIVDSACPSLLCTLRLVSRWVRLEVDSRLTRHICETDEKNGTAFLNLQLNTTDTQHRIVFSTQTAKVFDMDASALVDWMIRRSMSPSKEQREAAAVYPGPKLLVRYHMRDLVLGESYLWKPARRAVHFVDTTSFFYGLHAREAAYVPSGERENEVVFHVSYDLLPTSSWEFREFGVRRVHNRGLTLLFSPDNVSGLDKACIVLLRVLERIVENYAETGDSVTLVGVVWWHAALMPSPDVMELDWWEGWEDAMPMQAKIEWWARYAAESVPDERWVGGSRETPEKAVRCLSLEEWRSELGSHLFELMMDPGAVYWGP